MTDEPKKKEAPAPQPKAEKPRKAVNVGGLIVLGVIVLLLGWYLIGGRYTPVTSQARVQGYVIGVAPKVGGLVTEVFVTNNQEVREGDKLFQIDTSQFKISLDTARSNLEAATRQVDAGDAAVEAAKANLNAAMANQTRAEKDASRLQRLKDQDPGTISQRRLEVSLATLDQAKAAVVAAEAGIQQAIQSMGGQDSADNAYLKGALSAVEKAELDLGNTTVRASNAGMVSDLRADVGIYAGAGSPVLTLISMHDVWINAEFTENNLGHLMPGNRTEILFDVRPGHVYEGRVRSIGLGVGWGQNTKPGTLPAISNDRDWLRQAQRFPVIIEFDTDQDAELYSLLRVGGQATVIAYAKDRSLLNLMGKFYIRLMGVLSYAY